MYERLALVLSIVQQPHAGRQDHKVGMHCIAWAVPVLACCNINMIVCMLAAAKSLTVLRNMTRTHLDECAVRKVAHDWLLQKVKDLHQDQNLL